MPITAKAQGKTFTFQDGTTPEQMGGAIDEFFGNQSQPTNDNFDLDAFNPAGDIAPVTPKDESGIQDQITALAETALTLATGATGGAAGMIGGTLEQLSKEILSGEFGSPEAAERVAGNAQKRSQQLTNLPETELGQKRVGQVGEVLAPLTALTPLAGEFAALGQASRPAVSALSKAPKQVFEGAKGLQTTGKRELAREIQAGTVSPEAAKFKLKTPREFQGEPTGIERFFDTRGPKIEADSLAGKAVKQGFDPGVIQPLKMASKADKAFMKKMAGIQGRIAKDKLFGMKNRPGDVAGDVLMGKVKIIRDANKRAGLAINREADNLRGKTVDVSGAGDKFLSSLDDIGVTVGDDFKLNFKGSDIEFQGGPKSTLRNVFSRMNGDVPTAYEVHQLKRLIDSEVTYGKNLKGLAGGAERALKELRANLDEILDTNFPNYDKANIAYRETISALDALQDVAGKKMNLSGPNADKATGTLMRRLMSNAQSRVTLLDALTDIEAAVKKHGGGDLLRLEWKAIPDNLEMLVLFADELDSVFGPAARTSLQGQFDQALKQGARAATTKTGAVDVGLGLAGKGVEKLRGINQQNALKAIKELLEE